LLPEPRSDRAIRFQKGHSVFNVEQIDGLPETFYARAEKSADVHDSC
jgi:antirestriction protein ArdC